MSLYPPILNYYVIMNS